MKSNPTRLRRIFSLPHLPIWLAPFVLLAPVYLTGKALFWGTPLLQFGPWWSYAWQTLLAGHLPLWDPLLGMGAPLLANYQSALLYPPNWIYLALYGLAGVPLMAWGMALIAALHLVWAAVGMAAIARRLGLGVLAQAVSGLAFGLSGYLVARLGFLSITSTAAWLPWVLLYLTPRLWRAAVIAPGLPEAGFLPGDAVAGRPRPNCLVHTAAGGPVGGVLGGLFDPACASRHAKVAGPSLAGWSATDRQDLDVARVSAGAGGWDMRRPALPDRGIPGAVAARRSGRL